MRSALVCGAGGFIGSHLVTRLKHEGYWVRGADLKLPEFGATTADDFEIGDLRHPELVEKVVDRPFDEVYQLAADMGGAGYIFSGEHDADVMHNSATINLNVARRAVEAKVGRLFYSSSACIYPERNQLDPDNPDCSEDSAYPADPDSEYGWEKLFSERMYQAYNRNYGLDVRIARFHNIFGPQGTWEGGREKAPAAICRKVAEAPEGGEIDIWGDGRQTRTFLYIDECLEGVRRLMDSDFAGPVNIGSDEMISINRLAEMAMEISGKPLRIRHVDGALGVRGRSSDNRLVEEMLGWRPRSRLIDGMRVTYVWVDAQVRARELLGVSQHHPLSRPTISIVTPSFNQAEFIERTIESILGQGYPNLELIVMDGASTDGTVEILERYGDRLRWRSEPDSGQSEAINKGLRLATGEIVAFLNSDDEYLPGSLAAVAGFFEANPEIKWAYGKCRIIDAEGAEIRRPITWYKNQLLRRYSYRRLLSENFISQPATFWRREVHDEIGYFDEDDHWCMDYEFWLRLGSQYPAGVIDRYLASFRYHLASKSAREDKTKFQEEYRIAKRYGNGARMPLYLHKLNYFKIVGIYQLLARLRRLRHRVR